MKTTQGTRPYVRPEEQVHRKQFFWQILLPVLLAVVVMLGAGIIAILTGGSANVGATRWAMISTILLVLPWLIFCLLPLALMILGILFLRKSHKSISPYLAATAYLSNRMRNQTESISQVAVSPLIRVSSIKAGLTYLLKKAFQIDSPPEE